MIKKIIQEPLVHFLVAGFCLFLYFKSCSGSSGLENTILVNEKNMLNFIQFQSKAFNPEVFETKMAALPASEKKQLIQNFIREEALYREAVKFGMDQNDYVLKKRIIQKMEFILDDFDETTVVLNEDSLKVFFEAHQKRYFQPTQYSFTHIFFKETGDNDALERAQRFMDNPSNIKLAKAQSLKFGDRFLYHRNYSQKNTDFLESQFGEIFTNSLQQLSANEEIWQGPIASIHGQHWLKLTHKTEAGTPKLSAIHSLVKSDYLDHLKKQHKEQQIEQVITKYQVEITWE